MFDRGNIDVWKEKARDWTTFVWRGDKFVMWIFRKAVVSNDKIKKKWKHIHPLKIKKKKKKDYFIFL